MEIERCAKYSLFTTRRFLPAFAATFLGSFNDNLIRSGLVVLIAYSGVRGIALPARPEILVTICSALLVMPMLLFSSIAGSLADKYEKSRLVRFTKIAEMGIMAAAYYGFAHNNILLLMGLLFISGTHTTFYSPIKFSILPDHLRSNELLAGNGFMAGGNYLAVLFGLIAGGLLIDMPDMMIGKVALGIALAGLAASWFIPPSAIAQQNVTINFHIWRASKEMIIAAAQDRTVLRCIFALSWFLLIGGLFMAQFANYAQSVVRGNNEVYILFLTVFSIGIAAGSLLCDTLLKGVISLKLTPFALAGISLFTYLMVYTTPPAGNGELVDAAQFLAVPQHWQVLACMVLVALCGGIYIVPLYATLQSHTPVQFRSRIMAASNVSDSVCLTLSALVCAVLLSLGLRVTDLFLLVATLNLAVVCYARKVI